MLQIDVPDAKAPLYQQIKAAYNTLAYILSQIPADKRTLKAIKGTGGNVSVADIVAYQIGWGLLLVCWYEAGLRGEIPQMPGEGFTIWDYTGIAKHFYTKYHYDGACHQDEKLYAVVERIIQIVEAEYQAGNLDRLGVWPWCTLASGKQWELHKWIKVNTVSPYKRAAMLARKFLKDYF